MRIGMLSALWFLPPLVHCACPAVAQSSPAVSQPETYQTHLLRHNGPSALGILPQVKASQCAHIVILETETKTDSKMVAEVPREFSSNMPILEGLPQPCYRDSHAASKSTPRRP